MTDSPHPWLSSQRDFRTTHWSLVAQATADQEDDAQRALSMLCRAYWLPLHTFVKRRGYSDEEAKDLTQAFFARLLERQDLIRVDAERGRFRTFLRSAMTNFLNNDWRDTHRLKRGGGSEMLSLEETNAEGQLKHQISSEGTPERDYDRQWVQALLATVLERLRREAAAAGREQNFEQLKHYLIGDRGDLPYAEAGERLSMTEGAVKAAVYRLRLRYGEVFREEVARTVENDADLDEEIRHLLSVIS
jgi:RNA polymerase sigma factor (sigma-70 family)